MSDMSINGEGSSERGGGSHLAALLECERELAELLDRTREHARGLIEHARAAASQAGAELEASLEETSELVRREVGEASRARVREILTRARAQAAGFESLSEADVDRLAESAFGRLLDGGGRA